MRTQELTLQEKTALDALEARVGRLYLRQRLGLERDCEAHVFKKGTHLLHIENWYSIHGIIRGCLRVAGLHQRGRRNALALELRRHDVLLPHLPEPFDGFTLLHLSDLHLDLNPAFVDRLIARIQGLTYDLCVITGDYRVRTFGPYQAALSGLERLRPAITAPAYAVLGNHDTIRMVPGMEAAGYEVLLNESKKIVRGGEAIYVAGIDDAHYYRTENFHRAAQDIPHEATAILLSHTPEAYRHAAHAGFALMLSGHTHGGQICLPGGVAVLTDADCPRALVRGPWSYHGMSGYTSAGAGASIVDVRLNCPPEVTLHRVRRAP